MLRKPVVSQDSVHLSRPQPNRIGQVWSSAVEKAFEDAVVPSFEPLQSFRSNEAPYYVNVRRWPDDPDTNQSDEELDLHQRFWKPDAPKIIFIEGEVGLGKST